MRVALYVFGQLLRPVRSIAMSVSVCLSERISQKPRFQTSLHFLCCCMHVRGSVLLWRRRDALILPVFWIPQQARSDVFIAITRLLCNIVCVVSYRQQRVPRCVGSVVQRVPESEYADTVSSPGFRRKEGHRITRI